MGRQTPQAAPAVLLSAVVALCAGASPLPKGVESDPDLAEFKALLRTFEERQREHQLGLDVGREPDSVWLKTCSGWMAQELCSTIFGSGIDEATAVREDVGHIPRAASDYRVDYEDRSVTATCKWANPSNQTYKSIWRDGIGCTLVERLSEAEIRAQALGRIHPAAPLDPSVPWPLGEGFFPELAPEGADLECVARVSAGQFADRLTNPRAIVVVYKGQLIFEQYARGITKNNKLLGWSATKSLTGTLVGIAAGQGKLDIYAPAPVPEWANDARANITVDQMLRMVSGTRWVGDLVPSTECLFYSDANCAHTSAQQPLVTEPGAEWNYNSGSSYILSRIALEQRTDQDRFNNWEWPKHKLFFPIGAQSMYIEYQPNGLFLGGAYGYGTPRDWARFGLLHLRDGVWVDGNRVLPEGWSQYARSPSDVNPGYAAHFWRSPSVDEKLFYASGFRNQNTFIFPSQDLVIVRMAMPPLVAHPIFDATAFLNDMLSCFP